MKNAYLCLLAALSLFLGASVIAQTTPLLPQPPAIWREVTGVTNSYPGGKKTPVVTRPHIPAFRVSRDGRIGLRVISGVGFALMMPEKLTNYALLTQNSSPVSNSYVMSSTTYKYVDGCNTAAANETNFYAVKTNSQGGLDHVTLYDPTPEFPQTNEIVNPTNVGGADVYYLTVISAYTFSATDPNTPNSVQIFATPVKVVVTNPKATNAYISSVTLTSPPKGGPILGMTSFREPNVVGDGRLIVMRGAGALPWVDPVTGAPHPAPGSPTQSFDICYSYYTDTNAPLADPTQWTNIIPISHAPYDARLTNLFGFARQPFRDANGAVIPDGVDIAGTYPWIDRNAKNLFFTTVADTLRYSVGGVWTNINYSRYGQTNVPEDPLTFDDELGDNTRGICFAGLWSHGKMVMLDNLNNDMDYAMGDGTELGERLVHLFNSGMPVGSKPDWLRLGAGRVNSDPAMPVGDNRNSTVMDSLESTLNYRKFAVPTAIGDVVWPFHNAKNSDEVVFDDFVDPNAFIIANMAGATRFALQNVIKSTGNTNYTFIYYNGWNSTNNSWDVPVMLQNAATATTNYWVVPQGGLVVGTASATPAGRLEPAATGGIHGKGFWLTGSNGLQFSVVSQPQNVSTNNWYAGLFVDCRFLNDGTSRVLLTFPDSSSIQLFGRNSLQYFDAIGAYVGVISLPPHNSSSAFPDLLPTNGWAHLAWQIRNGGTNVDFLLNGLLYNSFTNNSALFQMAPAGELTVGQPAGASTPGFNGWIDDFVVLAHTVDPESACNHAGGTLVGLPEGYNGYLYDFATNFPPSTHAAISNLLVNSGQTAYPLYANYYNYTQDSGAYLGNIPTNVVSVRQAIHFPEGPLFYNAPRPSSSKNQFCLTCHTSDGLGGLSLSALMLNTNVNADVDNRRQPFQPFARVFGNIPGGYVDSTSLPTNHMDVSGSGEYIDDWLLPAFTNVTVETFTLVDAARNVDLTSLTDGGTVHLSSYPETTSFAIRANLNSEQGSVALSFDGQPWVIPNAIPYSVTLTNLTETSHTIIAIPSEGVGLTNSFFVNP